MKYGYMTLFVSALPASTTLALMNNHFEIRGDAHKLLTSLRRPLPQGAQDIGSWQVTIIMLHIILHF
jgi:anoctamin-1